MGDCVLGASVGMADGAILGDTDGAGVGVIDGLLVEGSAVGE